MNAADRARLARSAGSGDMMDVDDRAMPAPIARPAPGMMDVDDRAAPQPSSKLYQVGLTKKELLQYKVPRTQRDAPKNCVFTTALLLGLVDAAVAEAGTQETREKGRGVSNEVILAAIYRMHPRTVFNWETTNTQLSFDINREDGERKLAGAINQLLAPKRPYDCSAAPFIGRRRDGSAHAFIIARDASGTFYVFDAQVRQVSTGSIEVARLFFETERYVQLEYLVVNRPRTFDQFVELYDNRIPATEPAECNIMGGIRKSRRGKRKSRKTRRLRR